MSYSISFQDDRSIVSGLVPVSFQLDQAARPGQGPSQQRTEGRCYDDYVWLEYRRADGLAPGAVLQAIADLLTSVLQDMRSLEVPQEMALQHLGFRVVVERGGLHQAPRAVDLMTQFVTHPAAVAGPGGAGQQQQQVPMQRKALRQTRRNNARLADWVQWGILQKDPAKFRFVVHPITPATNPAAQGQ